MGLQGLLLALVVLFTGMQLSAARPVKSDTRTNSPQNSEPDIDIPGWSKWMRHLWKNTNDTVTPPSFPGVQNSSENQPAYGVILSSAGFFGASICCVVLYYCCKNNKSDANSPEETDETTGCIPATVTYFMTCVTTCFTGCFTALKACFMRQAEKRSKKGGDKVYDATKSLKKAKSGKKPKNKMPLKYTAMKKPKLRWKK